MAPSIKIQESNELITDHKISTISNISATPNEF